MTLYDSSVLIDYLDGVDETVRYIETRYDERTITIPLVMFELYQGEVFKSGPAAFDAVDGALDWLTVIEETPDLARSAGDL
ncbi:hypothetical protein [Halalkalicoccus sp. NIPERK01]|uniref:hypothetical protein n=1 Tax=Halalkalicoccus sp. NIPERK01 TaxID=3053469 RepID=UPI00256EFC60|nr:hypothetical protein [Halalkalicoccus sp. NIPERK01]MDL5360994.1 hypothetical protein [Halalkalicoccus sp. NIPERK01]